MDAELAASWQKRYDTPGIFRNTSYAATQRRRLDWLGAVVQYNPHHFNTKRPASSPPDPRVYRPIDPSHFNFSKAKFEEIVLRFATSAHGTARAVWSAASGTLGAATGDGEAEHTIFVNVNPLVDLHCLLVPHFPQSVDPQHMTPGRLAPALLLASSVRRADFRVGFNSLGAWATVNHIHWHMGCIGAFFENNQLPLERAARSVTCTLGPLTLHTVHGWPVRALHFALAAEADYAQNVGRLADIVGTLCEELAKLSVAHNLLIADHGRSVYVLPRKTQRGAAGEGVLNAALLEVCGLAIVFNDRDFNDFNGDLYQKLLGEAALSEEEFSAIREMAVKRIQPPGA